MKEFQSVVTCKSLLLQTKWSFSDHLRSTKNSRVEFQGEVSSHTPDPWRVGPLLRHRWIEGRDLFVLVDVLNASGHFLLLLPKEQVCILSKVISLSSRNLVRDNGTSDRNTDLRRIPPGPETWSPSPCSKRRDLTTKEGSIWNTFPFPLLWQEIPESRYTVSKGRRIN